MTNKQKVIDRINEVGYVDNFWCVDNYITLRLGAVIFELKKAGWEFRTTMEGSTLLSKKKNCHYYVTNKPEKVEALQTNI